MYHRTVFRFPQLRPGFLVFGAIWDQKADPGFGQTIFFFSKNVKCFNAKTKTKIKVRK